MYFNRQKWVQLSIDWMIYSQIFPTCIILFAYFSGYSKTSFEVREKKESQRKQFSNPPCQTVLPTNKLLTYPLVERVSRQTLCILRCYFVDDIHPSSV